VDARPSSDFTAFRLRAVAFAPAARAAVRAAAAARVEPRAAAAFARAAVDAALVRAAAPAEAIFFAAAAARAEVAFARVLAFARAAGPAEAFFFAAAPARAEVDFARGVRDAGFVRAAPLAEAFLFAPAAARREVDFAVAVATTFLAVTLLWPAADPALALALRAAVPRPVTVFVRAVGFLPVAAREVRVRPPAIGFAAERAVRPFAVSGPGFARPRALPCFAVFRGAAAPDCRFSSRRTLHLAACQPAPFGRRRPSALDEGYHRCKVRRLRFRGRIR
jgi:hypothetical protein